MKPVGTALQNERLFLLERSERPPGLPPRIGARFTSTNQATRGICRERKVADSRSRYFTCVFNPKCFGRMHKKVMQQLLQGLRNKITGINLHYFAHTIDTRRLQPPTETSGHLPTRNGTSSQAKKHGKIVHQKLCVSSSTRPSNNVRTASPSSASQSLPSRTSLAQGVTLNSDQLIRTTL